MADRISICTCRTCSAASRIASAACRASSAAARNSSAHFIRLSSLFRLGPLLLPSTSRLLGSPPELFGILARDLAQFPHVLPAPSHFFCELACLLDVLLPVLEGLGLLPSRGSPAAAITGHLHGATSSWGQGKQRAGAASAGPVLYEAELPRPFMAVGYPRLTADKSTHTLGGPSRWKLGQEPRHRPEPHEAHV